MDCEKFESAMIDELYEELDELTSAAAKRHAAGCARCASMLNGLRATRRVLARAGLTPQAGTADGASFYVDPPAHLEDRILAAAREAQRVVPFRRRVADMISAAGSWAMRPQTAMAAVFLLMIGSSVVFLRGGKKMSPSASAPMTVSEQGAPAAAPQSVAQARDESDLTEAKAAHGAAKTAPEPTAAASAASAVAMATTPQSPPVSVKDSDGIMDDLTGGQARGDKGAALASGLPDNEDEKKKLDDAWGRRAAGPSNAGAVGGAANYAQRGAGGGGYGVAPVAKPAYAAAPPPPAAVPAAPARQRPTTMNKSDPWNVDAPAATATAQASGPSDPSPLKKEAQDTSAFDAAKQQYAQKNYPEATRQFDALGASGDPSAPIWAARSTRDGSGCGAAVARYDSIAGRQAGTSAGNDALLEGGQCYRTMGQFEAARARLVRLLTVPSHAARAQRELDAMSPKATTKPAPRKAPEPSQQKQNVDNAY
jgi:hypothetical protein